MMNRLIIVSAVVTTMLHSTAVTSRAVDSIHHSQQPYAYASRHPQAGAGYSSSWHAQPVPGGAVRSQPTTSVRPVSPGYSDQTVWHSSNNWISPAVSEPAQVAYTHMPVAHVESGWNSSVDSSWTPRSTVRPWIQPASLGHTTVVERWHDSPGSGMTNDSCIPCFGAHETGLFGAFLYLNVKGADLPYATHVDGTTTTALPLAAPNSLMPDYEPGFRVGFDYAFNTNSSLRASYTFYESSTSDSVTLPGGTGFLRPELVHPNTLTVASDRLMASADYNIDFQMVDLDYRAVWCRGHSHVVNYSLGLRYGNLSQNLRAIYTNADSISVESEIDFNGVGPRIGLDFERRLGCSQLSVYGNAFATFLAGQFTADYLQQNLTSAQTQATAGLEDNRFVTQLELELGLGWQSRSRKFRVHSGYMLGGWFNTVTTPGLINGIQSGNTEGISDTLTYDGLSIRAEYRF